MSSECWPWPGTVNAHGYGIIGKGKRYFKAHRVVYELLRGKIPSGLVIDHLCRNRECVNPDHLEPVADRVNILRGMGPPAVNARKTHCKHGHAFDSENTYVKPRGGRTCRTCMRRMQTKWREQRKALKT